MWETWVQSLGWEDPLEKKKIPTPVFWPGEFHGQYIHGVARSQMWLRDFHFQVNRPKFGLVTIHYMVILNFLLAL